MITYRGKPYESWQAARESLVAVQPTPLPAPPYPVPPSAAVYLAPTLPTLPAAAVQDCAGDTRTDALDRSIEDSTAAPRRSLTERYRPRTLAEVVGQPQAVAVLSAFVADPYPAAFVLSGGTGTGKTSAAWALAADLGCNVDATPPEWGGVYSIPSGEHTADALRELWPGLWTMPPESANGWKVVIINEVEALNGQVERLWLDRLEDLPPKTVIVFTTNDLASLPARFVDRCIGGIVEFQSSADDLAEPARALARRIWRAETGGEVPADVLDRVVSRATQAGRLSLRRVVQALVPLCGASKGR